VSGNASRIGATFAFVAVAARLEYARCEELAVAGGWSAAVPRLPLGKGRAP
jgi:hypothetical protein